MKLYNMHHENIEGDTVLTVSINSESLGYKELWFSTPLKYSNSVAVDRYDAFLVGILYTAMMYGEDIYIEGTVSSLLLFNINNYVIPLILAYSNECRKIKVSCDKVTTEIYNSKGVGTGFSGGIDSFCTIYDHFEMEKDIHFKINSLLFLNVGSHGGSKDLEGLEAVRVKFVARYSYLKEFTNEIGLDFIPVDSNLHLFHPWGHQKTHTLTSAAGVLLLQKKYNTYYYASSGLDYKDTIKYAYKYENISIGAFSDPILLPLLSTESLRFVADGVQYSRSEKTLRILDYKPVYKYLNVCVSGDDTHKNCSICSKCARTLFTVDSIGVLAKFSGLFDINKYKDIEKKYIRQQVLKQARDPYANDNIELAKKYNIELPGKISSFIKEIPTLSKNSLKFFALNNLSDTTLDNIRSFVKKSE